MLGPGVNILRTPLCGRNFEYLGEDPFLTSRLAVGYIRGEQSQDISACVKHFALNNQESQRGTINVEVDERALREIGDARGLVEQHDFRPQIGQA